MNRVALKQFNKAYQQDALEATVYGASPVGLIVLLYDGAISALQRGRVAIEHKDYAEKARVLGKALDIVDGLNTVLDMQKGGEISGNLHDLYLYVKSRIGAANIKNDVLIVDEALGILGELADAWRQLDRQAIAASASRSRV